MAVFEPIVPWQMLGAGARPLLTVTWPLVVERTVLWFPFPRNRDPFSYFDSIGHGSPQLAIYALALTALDRSTMHSPLYHTGLQRISMHFLYALYVSVAGQQSENRLAIPSSSECLPTHSTLLYSLRPCGRALHIPLRSHPRAVSNTNGSTTTPLPLSPNRQFGSTASFASTVLRFALVGRFMYSVVSQT